MSALPKLEQITSRPAVRPVYAQALSNVNAFVCANLDALRTWYAQLSSWTDTGMPFDEFCRIQYDIEVENNSHWNQENHTEMRDQAQRTYDACCDRATGINKTGPL